MKFHQLADSAIEAGRSPLSRDRAHDSPKRRLCLSICIICIGTVAAMGSGSGGGGGGGGGGPVESAPLRQEVGAPAFKLYNQGVDLMHAKNFAAAQVKFEQAIRYKPDFAEAHNNLGFTLRQQGRRIIRKPLNITIRLFSSNRVWPRPMSIGECSLQKWPGKPTQNETWLLSRS